MMTFSKIKLYVTKVRHLYSPVGLTNLYQFVLIARFLRDLVGICVPEVAASTEAFSIFSLMLKSYRFKD